MKRKVQTKAHGLDDGGRTQGKCTTSRRVESLDRWPEEEMLWFYAPEEKRRYW